MERLPYSRRNSYLPCSQSGGVELNLTFPLSIVYLGTYLVFSGNQLRSLVLMILDFHLCNDALMWHDSDSWVGIFVD